MPRIDDSRTVRDLDEECVSSVSVLRGPAKSASSRCSLEVDPWCRSWTDRSLPRQGWRDCSPGPQMSSAEDL